MGGEYPPNFSPCVWSGGGEVSQEGCQARLPGRPSCPFQSTTRPLPAPSQQAHPAAAGTTQPGLPLAPMSPSSGEVEFNLFFPHSPSQTSTRDPDPPQPEPMTSHEPFSLSSQISPVCGYWEKLPQAMFLPHCPQPEPQTQLSAPRATAHPH